VAETTTPDVDGIYARTDAMLEDMTTARAISLLLDTHGMCIQHAKTALEPDLAVSLLVAEGAQVAGILRRLDPEAFADGMALYEEGRSGG
jgi:hypothetical protein